MKRILVTGATGNVGRAVIKALLVLAKQHSIIAGVRNIETDRKTFAGTPIQFQHFDFEDEKTFHPAFSGCDILFLLRPPQISDVQKYFTPLIESAKKCNIEHVVFLSVQGVEKSRIIPHYKIEKLIVDSNIPYTLMRPAYFMQNFTTTLRKDLVEKRLIFLPAGKAKFTVIDTSDIGMATAIVLRDTSEYKNKCYELTNYERLTFGEMAQKISAGIGQKVSYKSPGLLKFFFQKRKENVPTAFIFVMILLHYLPRFQKEPQTTNCVESLTGKQPKTFDQFVKENKNLLCRQ